MQNDEFLPMNASQNNLLVQDEQNGDDVLLTFPLSFVVEEANNTAATNQEQGEGSSVLADEDIELPSIQREKQFSSASPCPQLTESLVAQQMNNLSVKDRDEVYSDIHGVSGIIDEDTEPGFLERQLNDMQYELETIDATNKKAYLMVLAANPEYVQDQDLRLRFLRADRFEAKLAAQRYAYHFDTKWKLFGSEKLGRDIIQEDLDSETLDALYCGFNQLMPQRDSAGRAIFLYVSNVYQHSYSDRAVMRRYFFNSMLVSEDVETQQKGVVGVMYALGGGDNDTDEEGDSISIGSSIERGGVGRAWKLFGPMCRAAPLRIVGFHCCYDNLAWLPVVATMRVAADSFSRLRFRVHQGSHADCMGILQTFGIPTGAFPVNENGQVLSDKYREFLEQRRVLENQWMQKDDDKNQNNDNDNNTTTTATSATSNHDHKHTPNYKQATLTAYIQSRRVFLPSSRDVLLGRGQGFFNHIGNLRYRSIIEDLKDDYDNSEKRGVKKQIAQDVVRRIYQLGGRFLKYDEQHGGGRGGWAVVEEEVAFLKVGHSFRAERNRSAARRRTSETTATTTPKQETSTTPGDDVDDGSVKNGEEGQDPPTTNLKRTGEESEESGSEDGGVV